MRTGLDFKSAQFYQVWGEAQWRKFTFSGGGGGGGGQSHLNFLQNFQISDKPPPPPFALEKAVFSPLLGQRLFLALF